METTAFAILSRTGECAALLAVGYQLRSARLFSSTDAEVGTLLMLPVQLFICLSCFACFLPLCLHKRPCTLRFAFT
jgi:hypothetical protein